jgi:hypothetical protein
MRLPDIFKNPRVAAITGVILGLILGLMVGWWLWPVEYTDAVPEILTQQYQEEYMRMAIDSYGVRQDPILAAQRWVEIGKNAPNLFLAISQNPGNQDIGAILGYKAAIESKLGSVTTPAASVPTTTPSGTTSPWGKYVLPVVIGVLLLFALVVAIYFGRRFLVVKTVAREDYSAARQAQEITNSVEKTDFSGLGLAKPVTQTMTTYVLGDDLYDESFSIDAPSGEFLGEYGVGVSETMGVGEPKKVTAIEIWMFDKNDIKTATKVLMSPYAFGDQNIRARLEAKGELVPIQAQGQVMLETATLQLLATVVDLEYGRGNLPEKSYFERITLELAIWPK